MPKPITKNTLFFGDNLPILREYIADESIDLIYLDPPFNSNRSYNVLFRDESGQEPESQIQAFEDTWHWNEAAQKTYAELLTQAPAHVSAMINALHGLIGANQMMAYLVMMAARLVELHRVLKTTGSLYLHCDPTASHYLKIVLDTIFDFKNFRNEIVWQRTIAKALTSRQLPNNHDIILCYQKSDKSFWNADTMFQKYDSANLDEKAASKYHHTEPDGRIYRLDNLINPNPDRPNLTYEFLGVKRVWRWTKERMHAAYDAGLIVQTKPGAVPQLKRYLDEQRGRPLGDVWTDIPPINSQALERLGYPTQKPLALLERIIQASSNQDDFVLDPFCGCGTAIVAAEELKRRWIGIDITHLAIALQKSRLKDMYDLAPGVDYDLECEPKDIGGARQLAQDNRYQFQWWALSLVQAKPLGGQEGQRTGKKGSDKGIDGVITFQEAKEQYPRVLVQVKSGHVKSGDIRDLIGTVKQNDAAMGVFITLEPPTRDMQKAAVSEGFYHSAYTGKDYPKIQILTIEELLHSAEIKMPPTRMAPNKQAERVKEKNAKQGRMDL